MGTHLNILIIVVYSKHSAVSHIPVLVGSHVV